MDSGYYDEDLNSNEFLITLQTEFSRLYDEVCEFRYTICVPRQKTFEKDQLTAEFFTSHIIKSSLDKNALNQPLLTFNEKELSVVNGELVTGVGFTSNKTCKILFEETFYNANDESYKLLCINSPLEGSSTLAPEIAALHLSSLSDCENLLWEQGAKDRFRRKILLRVPTAVNQINQCASIEEISSLCYELYNVALHISRGDTVIRRLSRTNDDYHQGMQVAVETFVMSRVYEYAFFKVSTLCIEEDLQLNKITRSFSKIQLQELELRPEHCVNVPFARRALHHMLDYKTPLEMATCLKQSIEYLTDPPTKTTISSKSSNRTVISADELMPILIFLVVKSDIPCWNSILKYIHHFSFNDNGTQPYNFHLTSFEAAIDFITSGLLKKMIDSQIPSLHQKLPFWEESVDTGMPSKLDVLFMRIRDSDVSAVEDILKSSAHGKNKSNGVPSDITVYSRDENFWTPLHAAAFYGKPEIVDTLLAIGFSTGATQEDYMTPLHLAASRGHQHCSLLLLHHGSSVNCTDSEGQSPLHLAVLNCHIDVVRALVYHDHKSEKLNIDLKTNSGSTALHFAAKWGYKEIVEVLLENNASVSIRDGAGKRPSELTFSLPIRSLLDSFEAMPSSDQTDSVYSVSYETGSLASESISSRRSRRFSSKSLDNLNQKYSKLSLSEPAQDKQQYSRRVKKLLKAVTKKDVNMVRYLLGISTSPFDYGKNNTSSLTNHSLCHPLCRCEKCNNMKMSVLMVSNSNELTVNSCDTDCVSPLHIAAGNGYAELCTLLLNHGANPDAITLQKQTPLHWAARHDRPTIMSLLLQYGADCNLADNDGNTALHISIINEKEWPANVLITCKCKINLANNRGNTALHCAAMGGKLNLVERLLDAGANPMLVNHAKMTADHLAELNSKFLVARYIQQHIEGFRRKKSLPLSINISPSSSTAVSIEETTSSETSEDKSTPIAEENTPKWRDLL